jgi:hypothetical protein
LEPDINVGFDVLTAVTMENSSGMQRDIQVHEVRKAAMPQTLGIKIGQERKDQGLGFPCRLLLSGFFLGFLFVPDDGKVWSSETSVDFCRTTQHCNP